MVSVVQAVGQMAVSLMDKLVEIQEMQAMEILGQVLVEAGICLTFSKV